MAKTSVPSEGSVVGTEYLTVAQAIQGKMVILGVLEPFDVATKSRLEEAARDLSTPGNPVHVVKVTVVSRYLKLEGEHIALPITRPTDELL